MRMQFSKFFVSSAAVSLVIVVAVAAAAPSNESHARKTADHAESARLLSDLRQPVPMCNDYYVTGRYSCIDNDDNSSRGSCDKTTRANSCQEALQAQQNEVASADPCKYCTQGVTDNTKHWSRQVEWIHLGPCKGFPN